MIILMEKLNWDKKPVKLGEELDWLRLIFI